VEHTLYQHIELLRRAYVHYHPASTPHQQKVI
jgi:hypothetical protein